MSIKATRIGNTIVAFIQGKMYQKTFNNPDERVTVYETLLNTNISEASEVEEAVNLFSPDKTEVDVQKEEEFNRAKEEAKKLHDILDFMKNVKENGHSIFEVVDHSLYVKGIRISTPELLIREIIKAEDKFKNPYNYSEGIDDVCLLEIIKTSGKDRVNALINFWKLCALNPDPRARFDLFKFLVNHNLTITPSGHFVAYRTVNTSKEGDAELEKFVTQEYLKVKRWKKSPAHYDVVELEEGGYKSYTGCNTPENTKKEIGNLKDLYENIGDLSGNVYTDNHTKTMVIKMGEPVRMDRQKVDPDITNSCSYGLNM